MRAGIVSTMILVVGAHGALAVLTAPAGGPSRRELAPTFIGLAGMARATIPLLLRAARGLSLGPIRLGDGEDVSGRPPRRDRRTRPRRPFALAVRTGA